MEEHTSDNAIALIERELGKLKEFQPYVLIDSESKHIQIFLEDCPFYAEWIKGEGGDISLYRALDGDRVVGAMLPLRKWNGRLPVEII